MPGVCLAGPTRPVRAPCALLSHFAPCPCHLCALRVSAHAVALLEIQMGLALTLSKFDLEFADAHDDTYTQSIVCPMKHGLRVRAKIAAA